MRLILKDKKITVKQNAVPEDINNVSITYSYELGTNHLYPVLYINGRGGYRGDNITIPLNYNADALDIRVCLLDVYDDEVKVYESTIPYYKTCTLGAASHVNIYKKIKELETTIEELQEKGEVI